ncbi:MAG: hypothetical protein WCO71_11250 [Pseudomonadota bacterium]
MDATRLLTERIFGLNLNEESTVRDLAKLDDRVKGSFQQIMRGVVTTEGPTYQDDGRLEVVRAVKLAKVIEVIRDCYRQTQGKDFRISHYLEKREETDVIDVLGSAALAGSDGHKKIRAKRAAEMDAYRRLAERALGVRVSNETTLRNFVVSSDEIKAEVAALLKSAEVTRIVFQPDQTAEVTMKLAIGPLIKVIKKKVEADGKTTVVSTNTNQSTIEEVGRGTSERDPAVVAGESGITGPSNITTIEVQSIIDIVLKSN